MIGIKVVSNGMNVVIGAMTVTVALVKNVTCPFAQTNVNQGFLLQVS